MAVPDRREPESALLIRAGGPVPPPSAGSEAGPANGPSPRVRRAAYLAWIVCAAVVWNVVFDAIVIQSGRDYLTLQALRQQGRGPAVTIHGVMDAGVARAAREATRSGGAVGAAGMLAVWLVSRLQSRRSAAGPE
jgi:hypothetical protein